MLASWRLRAMTVLMLTSDDHIVSPAFSAFISVHWRSSAVETQVSSPFSVSLTLRSGHGDSSLFHLLRLGSRTSFRAEPKKARRTYWVRGRVSLLIERADQDLSARALGYAFTGWLAPLRFKGETVTGYRNQSGEPARIAFRSDG